MSKELSLRTLERDPEAIQQYLVTGRGQLSPALRERLKRLERVADLLAELSQAQVAKEIMRLWPEECSPATAYRLIDDAQDIFKPRAMYDRGFYADKLLADNLKAHRMAEAAQDFKAMNALEKTRITIIEKFMGTSDALPLDKIQPPRIHLHNDPALAGQALPANWQQQLEGLLKKRRATGATAEYTDFEDVPATPALDETQKPAAERPR